MPLSDPETLPRAFAHAWSSRDAQEIAGLFAPDGEFLSLTGGLAENREEIAELLAGELAGAFAKAKLVTGRCRIRSVGAEAAVVSQRFVLSGVLNADGSDAGRIGALLCATLAGSPAGWEIIAAQFVVEA